MAARALLTNSRRRCSHEDCGNAGTLGGKKRTTRTKRVASERKKPRATVLSSPYGNSQKVGERFTATARARHCEIAIWRSVGKQTKKVRQRAEIPDGRYMYMQKESDGRNVSGGCCCCPRGALLMCTYKVARARARA